MTSLTTHLTLIKPQSNNRIPTPPQALPHHSLNSMVPRRVHQVGKIPNLATDRRSQKGANVGAPIARAHRDAVNCAKGFDDAVARQVVHGRGDDAVGVGEAAG